MKYRKHLKLIKNLEKKLSVRNAKKVRRVFLDFTKKIKLDNKQNFSTAKVVVSIDYQYLYSKMKDALEVIYLYNFDETVKVLKNIYGKKLSEQVLKGVRDYFVEDYNKKNAMKKATIMSETTKHKLNKVIATAQKEGWSHDELVKELVDNVKGMSKIRASTIARTETSNSINNVSYETANKAKMKEKGWIHLGGHKTFRENHKRLNNKWIKIDEYWDLGNGVKARCPHDSSLPASEVVRCSCLQIYR